MGRALGCKVAFEDVPFDLYRRLGFPNADNVGNMFQFQAILGEEPVRSRDPERARSLNPDLLSFDAWLKANGSPGCNTHDRMPTSSTSGRMPRSPEASRSCWRSVVQHQA